MYRSHMNPRVTQASQRLRRRACSAVMVNVTTAPRIFLLLTLICAMGHVDVGHWKSVVHVALSPARAWVSLNRKYDVAKKSRPATSFSTCACLNADIPSRFLVGRNTTAHHTTQPNPTPLSRAIPLRRPSAARPPIRRLSHGQDITCPRSRSLGKFFFSKHFKIINKEIPSRCECR